MCDEAEHYASIDYLRLCPAYVARGIGESLDECRFRLRERFSREMLVGRVLENGQVDGDQSGELLPLHLVFANADVPPYFRRRSGAFDSYTEP